MSGVRVPPALPETRRSHEPDQRVLHQVPPRSRRGDEEDLLPLAAGGRRHHRRRARHELHLRRLPVGRRRGDRAGLRMALPDDREVVQLMAEAAASPARDDEFRWYIVHTYSGFEERVKDALRQRADALGMAGDFGEIRIPTETVVELKAGKKRETQRKFFPGYILVQMRMSDPAWHVVRNTPKVTGLVGTGKKPTPLTAAEVDQILEQVV